MEGIAMAKYSCSAIHRKKESRLKMYGRHWVRALNLHIFFDLFVWLKSRPFAVLTDFLQLSTRPLLLSIGYCLSHFISELEKQKLGALAPSLSTVAGKDGPRDSSRTS